jgi:hypothetical protein
MSPSIGMHANAGITFDLDKIRAVMPEVKIAQFTALGGISETVAQYSTGYLNSSNVRIEVDLWVLVDGQVRFAQRLAAVPSQAVPIRIPLQDGDRFLTLVTTDRNDKQCIMAWSLFAEPALELAARP